jgi:hypothetical protein
MIVGRPLPARLAPAAGGLWNERPNKKAANFWRPKLGRTAPKERGRRTSYPKQLLCQMIPTAGSPQRLHHFPSALFRTNARRTPALLSCCATSSVAVVMYSSVRRVCRQQRVDALANIGLQKGLSNKSYDLVPVVAPRERCAWLSDVCRERERKRSGSDEFHVIPLWCEPSHNCKSLPI